MIPLLPLILWGGFFQRVPFSGPIFGGLSEGKMVLIQGIVQNFVKRLVLFTPSCAASHPLPPPALHLDSAQPCPCAISTQQLSTTPPSSLTKSPSPPSPPH
ncbi:macrophage mannose receptor 1-like [Platysternon megacephalum]|uniref:Macrophage mannose receptor 1-like n=1 Tax=Platysternon megacephalum TaxID=55544 RepID=A0A4D9DR05_9SAUR|nr:macrophage mannose receptor 1-like [Platysternon megacephalum]